MSWPTVSFGDVLTDATGGNVKIKQSDYLTEGQYAIVDQGQSVIGGYTDEKTSLCKVEGPVIIFGDHTKALKYVDFPFCLGADGTKVLKPKPGTHAKYLYYALHQVPIPEAGYSRHFKYLKAGEIPLPPLEEQKRIAGILDQAAELCRLRTRSLDKLNTLGQAIFHEMFGAKEQSSSQSLGEHLTFVTSGGRGWAKYYSDAGPRFIRSLDVQVNEIGDDEVVSVTPPDNAEARRTKVQAGDVLLTITGSKIGRAAPVPASLEGSFISQHVAILRPNTATMHPTFLSHFINMETFGQRQIRLNQYGQAKPGLNFEQIRGFQIPAVGLEQQVRFVQRVEECAAAADLMKNEGEISQSLFASLQHRAFRGEL